jgi:hypothetical protein
MKKNLLLGGLLILILSLTFIFQEKRVEKEKIESQNVGAVFPEDIKDLELPHLEAHFKDGAWKSKDHLLSHNTMGQIEKKIQWVRKLKDVKGEWKTYFSDPLEFSVNGEVWTIGDLSLDRQSFYLARGKEIMLAEVLGENLELAHDETELQSIKYNELKGFISKSESELLENQLFRFYQKIPLERVTIESQGRLSFELNLEKNETLPPPLKGVAVHENLKAKFVSLLTQMNIRSEKPYPTKPLAQKLGELNFLGKEKKLKWELWLISTKSADAMILDPEAKKAYEMIGGTLKLFFVNLQDYWDKKIIPGKDFPKFSETTATFSQGTKSAKVIIKNREPLAFEATGAQVIQDKMEALVMVLFNLGIHDQADRISPLTETDKKHMSLEPLLHVDVMGQELMVWRKAGELIVVNLTQVYKVHFLNPAPNIGTQFKDVLK